MKTLLPEHFKAYLDAANARGVLPMFCLELVSGLRKGELVALLWRDLHPRHPTAAKSGGRDDRKFHGAGHVGQKNSEKARQEGETSCPALSVPFRTFSRVGRGVGQVLIGNTFYRVDTSKFHGLFRGDLRAVFIKDNRYRSGPLQLVQLFLRKS